MKVRINNNKVYLSNKTDSSDFHNNKKDRKKRPREEAIGTYNGFNLIIDGDCYHRVDEFPVIKKDCENLDKFLEENTDLYVTIEDFNDDILRCKFYNNKRTSRFNVIPNLDKSEMMKRYSNVSTVKIVGDEMFEFEKPSFDKLSSVAYMWNAEEDKIQDLDNLTLVAKLTTFHTYAFHGFFKPDLGEVLSQIPSSIDFDEKYYVTTNSYSDIWYETTCGNYHIGITSVYTCK